MQVNAVIHSLNLCWNRFREKQIALKVILEPELPQVLISSDQLKQVFFNMVRNAEDAMPQGGELVIRTAQQGQFVELSIADTGCGIPAEHREHIFDPFFTTKRRGRGMGLGLSVSYGIITAASGRIEVESEVGKGSMFRVSLPAVQEVQRGTNDASNSPRFCSLRMKQICGTTWECCWQGEGYRVVSAADGAEGIRKLQEEPFDLVITDVVMPEVDGFQVMEYLKDYAPDTAVVAITGYVSTESAIEALRRGAYDYIAKPFDVDLMQLVVKRALEKARMQKAFRQYMGELERQVEERTRNLAEANFNLEQSMEELRATQEQFVQTERFRALGEVTASVAHDLGDSLAMIVGFAQVLAKIAPAESRMKAQLEQIGEMAFGCHEIVKNLVNFPWKQPSQKVQTHLNALCEEMLAGLAYQADLSHIVVERQLDGSLPPIMADPHQLCRPSPTLPSMPAGPLPAIVAVAALRLRRSGAMASFKSPFKWIDLGLQKAATEGFSTHS